MFDGKQIRDKLVGSDENRAVSPVIGVILMVAITVILAAVIAAFVLDLGSGMDTDPQAGVTVDEDSGEGEVTVTVSSLNDADGVVIVDSDGDIQDHLASTGSSATYDLPDPDSETYSAVAYFGEGTDSGALSEVDDITGTSSVATFDVDDD
ncbi:type IV pilin [Halobiforma nitratireducens]|uniref:Archaeal Type IV pilin N-terminal domain-containing protein n=1 Tax=Halobiforma nitratireducens JCM 10879 TaxID=1227454 RepID=M0LJR1_9EURY|nr:type IV pilin N-terminal domain-containing protein [Halobiforma nitratireducens]EMA33862.1 hypothetical protein C446_13754 [Halobiforma nitratireducens JCM 10879]